MATFRAWARALALSAIAAVVIAMTPGQAFAARFAISGTVHSTNRANETWIIITSDVIGSPQAITVDMSRFSRLFRDTAPGTPVSLVIESRESDTFKATDLIQVAGNYVNQTNFGTLEQFNPRNDSIQAHSKNTPEDDEALAKQHRDSNLRREEDDK